MLQFLKARWELFIAMILFIAVKIPVLHYPFYWDESWSYAPGEKLMYLHGPSLMPNAIDLFYSRGHPLLFYALSASWMRLFGDSHVAQHAFCLFVSLLLLLAVFEVCLSLFGRQVARASLLLVPLQVMFFVQSTFLLPEVMIGLLGLLTLYCYVNGKYVFAWLCCSALLLTKESGMVMGLVLGMHAAANLLNVKEPVTTRVASFLSMVGAGIVIVCFYLLQKKLNGWYLFPEHTGLIVLNWNIFWNKFRYALDVLFGFDMRYQLFHLLLLLAVITAVRVKDIKLAWPLVPGYLIYVIVEDKFLWMPRKILFVVFLVSLAITAWQMVNLSVSRTRPRTRFIYLGALFFAAYLCFSCINFFSSRYLICVLVILLIFVAIYLDIYIARLYETIRYIVLGCIIVISIYAFKYDTGIGDTNFGAFDAMHVQEEIVNYLERNSLYNENIAATNFQQREHLEKPFTGFRHTPSAFTKVSADTLAVSRFILFDNVEPDPRYSAIKKDTANFRLLYHAEKGQAWSDIYERKK